MAVYCNIIMNLGMQQNTSCKYINGKPNNINSNKNQNVLVSAKIVKKTMNHAQKQLMSIKMSLPVI